ncbi:MAG: O-antigen polymerase [Saprospiraceae bacterium]
MTSEKKQLEAKYFAILLIAFLSVAISVVLPQLLNGWRFWETFGAAQLAYAVPTFIAVFTVLLNMTRGIAYMLSPVVSIMVGFLLFLSAGPLINPVSTLYNIELYTTPAIYQELAGFYGLAVSFFLLGMFLVPKPLLSKESLMRWGFSIHLDALWFWFLATVFIILSCFGLLMILNDLTPRTLFFNSGYAGGNGFSNPKSQYFVTILQIWNITGSILAITVFILAPQRKRKFIAIGVIGTIALYMVSRGVRFHFIYCLGGTILVWWYLSQTIDPIGIKKRMKKLWVVGIAIVILTSQMIIVRNTPGGLPAFINNGGIQLEHLNRLISYDIDRNKGFQQTLEAVPHKRDYIRGRSLVSPFVSWIPRVFWEGKPKTAWAYMEGYSIFENANNSYSILGELHMNFGRIGILIGMLFSGMFAQRWHDLYLLHSTKIPFIILYAMSLPFFAFFVRGDFQAAFNSMFYPMLLVFAILKLSKVRVNI